jgi:hypothetical protein
MGRNDGLNTLQYRSDELASLKNLCHLHAIIRQECPLSPFPFLLIVKNVQESNMSLTRLSVTDSATKQEAIN